MIKFESFANSIDNIELKPSESFAEIKNEGPISKEQAIAFWDDIFDEKEPKETFDIFDYLPEIFGRSEKEFEFDVDFTDDLAECLDEFDED